LRDIGIGLGFSPIIFFPVYLVYSPTTFLVEGLMQISDLKLFV